MIDVATILFYIFAAVLLGAGLAVITAKNPVHSVFFLILAFFNAAALFVLLGAEYLAMTLVVVYVGAVAVLFLFVVMMLNIHFEQLRAGFIRMLPLGVLVGVTLFLELGALLYESMVKPLAVAPAGSPIPDNVTNTQAIGMELYTHYGLLFQIAGLILLVAMIGAIVLTLRHRFGVRRQRISQQVSRTADIELVRVKSGQGAGEGV